MKLSVALVFCFSLPSFLLSQDLPQLGAAGPSTAMAAAPSVQQAAAAPSPGYLQPVETPSGDTPIAPPDAPAAAPSGPPAQSGAAVPSGDTPVAPPEAPAAAPSGDIGPAAALPSGPPAAEGGAGVTTGAIKRVTKEQVLATIPPNVVESLPFISSPSGKYVAYLVRSETLPLAGGFGNDFCYIQIKDAGAGQTVWESDCAPASISNGCSLLFTQAGLEVFDGRRSAWDAGVHAHHLETLELVDEGDMRIRTRDGDLAWRASDQPLANQRCGAPGSPGLPSGLPPFAAPVEGTGNLPFGRPSGELPLPLPAAGPLSGAEQPGQKPALAGFAQLPAAGNGQGALVDNTPFDSGCAGVFQSLAAMAVALVLTFTVHGFTF